MSVLEQPSADVSLSPGAILRQAREEAGLTLDVVSQRTMIPLSRLKALENDDYDRVGVATFVIGYTRSYARFLGLDPGPLVQTLEPALPRPEAVPAQAPSVALALQVQKRPRSLFWPTVFAVIAVLVVVAIIGVNTASFIPHQGPSEVATTNSEEPAATESSAAVSIPLSVQLEASTSGDPEMALPVESASTQDMADSDFTVAPLTTGTPLTTETPSTTVTPSKTVSSPSGAEPSQQSATSDVVSTPAPAAKPDPETKPDPAPKPDPGTAFDPSAPLDKLTFSFSEDCWISVTDATGKALIARLATSGDNLQLFGRAPFEVVLGNASGASVAFNGKALDAGPLPGRKFRRLTVGE